MPAYWNMYDTGRRQLISPVTSETAKKKLPIHYMRYLTGVRDTGNRSLFQSNLLPENGDMMRIKSKVKAVWDEL
jgi:hypothetical protein